MNGNGHQSRIDAFTEGVSDQVRRRPGLAAGGSAVLGAALMYGVPAVMDAWTERAAAVESRIDNAYKAHLETLGGILTACEESKQRLVVRLRECVESCSGGTP